MMLWIKCLCPLKIYVLKSNPYVMVFEGGTFGR